jgi:hypothetical protein
MVVMAVLDVLLDIVKTNKLASNVSISHMLFFIIVVVSLFRANELFV